MAELGRFMSGMCAKWLQFATTITRGWREVKQPEFASAHRRELPLLNGEDGLWRVGDGK